VKERITVREFHFASNWNHQKIRLEAFIFLYQFRDISRLLLRRRNPATNGSQPHDRLRGVFQTVAISRQFDAGVKNLLAMGTDSE
jgi:hypothetical protein